MMLTELDKNKCVFATIAIHAVGLLANLLKIIADLKVCHKGIMSLLTSLQVSVDLQQYGACTMLTVFLPGAYQTGLGQCQQCCHIIMQYFF